MNILMIVLNQVGVGTYLRAYHLAKPLVKLGNQVTVICTSARSRLRLSEYEQDGVQIMESPDLLPGMLRSGWDAWNVIRRMTYIKRGQYDVVHAFESRPTVIYPARYARWKGHIPLILDWADLFGRGGSVEERTNPVLRGFLRPVETFFEEHYRNKADGATVISTYLKEKVHKLGLAEEKILYLPNGTDPETLSPLDKQTARQQAGLPADTPIIGYMGTIFSRDAHLMMAAFDTLLESYPDTRLVLVGRQKVDLHRLTRHPASILQLGRLPHKEMCTWLSAVDLFWLPMSDSIANLSRVPLKFHDYLSLGRPIIATAVGDIKNDLPPEAGLTCVPEPESIARLTGSLLARPEVMEKMGKAARRLASGPYHWQNRANDLLSFYQRLINNQDA